MRNLCLGLAAPLGLFLTLALPATPAAPQAQKAPSKAEAKPSGLSIVQTVLHDRRENAPPIPSGYEYIGGELIYFSFRVSGYKVSDDKVNLRWLIYANDPQGVLLWEPYNGVITAEVTHNDENWLPRVQQTLGLPPQLPPGEYKLLIRVADEFAKTSTEQTVTFRVRGNPLPEPAELTILNPGFYRGDQDRTPLSEAVYRPGDTLWLRFQIAGFKRETNNRFHVEYGLRVLRPSGREMYAEPNAASESDTPYYPKRLMIGGVSLNLSADLTPGLYSIAITARDLIAQTSAESTVSFKVEK